MGLDFQRYKPPGPVGAAFIQSRGPIDIIMGPAGSGKTVCSVIKGPMLAASYMPVCRDGWVRFKLAVVRDTYRDFARTYLASWHEMFPADHPWTISYEGGQDRPIRHRMQWEAMRGKDKIRVDFQLETGAIGDHNVEQYIKGYELSAASGNECDLLDARVPGLLFQRTGRYPPVQEISPAELDRVSADGRKAMQLMGLTVDDGEVVLPRVFWGDMNPPDVDHPILVECGYGEHADKKNPAYRMFHQPGGLDTDAENRVGKPRSSYEMEAATQPDHIVRRMVHGLPGYVQDGKPVYPEFNQRIHVADQPLTPRQGVPLSTGKDAGGSPAGIITQFLPNGQMLVLAELCTEPGTGPARYSQMFYDLLMDQFPGFGFREAWGDPAAFYGADTQNGELAWMQTVGKALSMHILPTETNEPAIRQEAVRWYLSGMIDGQTPRMLIDPRCKVLIGGFAAHYKLTKQATAGGTDKLAVVKNKYSHIHDAFQYVCLGHRGLPGVMADAARLGRAGNVMTMEEARAQRESRRATGPKRDFSVWDV
ncbi:hypothetical protein FS782_13815 [Agrobacterium vitis]|uniref:hypothetical protein n=1 Tax=Agrobacterium vitis TaxID=373 RepID=UPI001F2C5E4E|nr:hypothetical protein [Agrobacterium vitis]MCF1478148.1 hypothetical protein [Agrobacterium vitis]